MKQLQAYALSTALLALGGLASCTEDNDWDVDGSYDRLFGVSDITVTPSALEATLAFTGVSGAEYYLVQYDTDSARVWNEAAQYSMTLENAQDATLSNLEPNTQYYLRMQACSTRKKDSNWVYYTKTSNGELVYYFKTDKEAILTADAESATQNSVTVKWEASGRNVSYITVSSVSSDEAVRYDLSSAEVSAEQKTITGLEEGTTYTVKIYNSSDECRGTATAATKPGMLVAGAVDHSSAALTWTAGSEASYLVVTAADGTSTRIDLDETAKNASAYTVTGLASETDYTIELFDANGRLGKVNVTTTKPAGDPTGSTLSGDLMTFAARQDTYTVGALTLTLTDTNSKITVDENAQYFGTATQYQKFTTRLKSGGKTSSSLALTLAVAKAGTLYIYARTGSSSTPRTLSVTQNGTAVFTQLLDDNNKVTAALAEEAGEEKPIFAVYSVDVKAGTYNIELPDGSVNIYGLKLVDASADQSGEETPSTPDTPDTPSTTGDLMTFADLQTSYTAGNLTLTVTGSMTVDANTQYFGTATAYEKFTTRLKTGGKSTSSVGLTLDVASAGTLYIYARSASSTASRSIAVGSLTQALDDANAIKATINTGEKEEEKSIFPVYTVSLAKGSYPITFPDGAINVYGFYFVAK